METWAPGFIVRLSLGSRMEPDRNTVTPETGALAYAPISVADSRRQR